ncbi:MAG: hypothetical protein U5K43_11700 [Halofilum sp. (in: g-proteobacteria)]|nr:hypothetical protein [Halofilum sp. (in: g-proteobacteria)]
MQPSTVAYIARLMIHRYHMLGILDEEGFPVQPMDVMFTDTGVEEVTATTSSPFQGGLRAAGANEVTPGRRCSECGNYAMIKRDGCDSPYGLRRTRWLRINFPNETVLAYAGPRAAIAIALGAHRQVRHQPNPPEHTSCRWSSSLMSTLH